MSLDRRFKSFLYSKLNFSTSNSCIYTDLLQCKTRFTIDFFVIFCTSFVQQFKPSLQIDNKIFKFLWSRFFIYNRLLTDSNKILCTFYFSYISFLTVSFEMFEVQIQSGLIKLSEIFASRCPDKNSSFFSNQNLQKPKVTSLCEP